MSAELRVESNTPHLLERGSPAPALPLDEPELPPEVPARYWTPDKASHVVAQICRAGSKFYGPSVKAAEWELELIGDPAAAVLNDWLPLRVGAGGDRTANLIALVAVAGILVLLRLPDILEVHGILKPWRSPEDRAREASRSAPAEPAPAPAQPAGRPSVVVETPTAYAGAPGPAQPFEPQLVGAGGGGTAGDERARDTVYGEQLVGGGGGFVERGASESA